jgi:hypothetical protein
MPNQISSKALIFYELLKTLDQKAKSELMELLANEVSNSANTLKEKEMPQGILSKINNNIIKEIDFEINALNNNIREKFIASALQLKELLINESIKCMPDVVTFNKGYVGLVWETKNNENIFIYSIPDGSLFYNKVGVNSSETYTMEATKENISNLIKTINIMV